MVDDTHDSRDEERGEDEGEGEEKQPFRGTFLLAPRFKKVACEEEERSRLACHLPASHAEGSKLERDAAIRTSGCENLR